MFETDTTYRIPKVLVGNDFLISVNDPVPFPGLGIIAVTQHSGFTLEIFALFCISQWAFMRKWDNVDLTIFSTFGQKLGAKSIWLWPITSQVFDFVVMDVQMGERKFCLDKIF